MKQHKVKPVEPDRTTIQHIEDGIDDELHASITGEYELPEGMTLEEFEEFEGGKLSDMSRETYDQFLAQYVKSLPNQTDTSVEGILAACREPQRTTADDDLFELLIAIRLGEIPNPWEEWTDEPVRSFECDSAVSCHKDDLPQDIKDRLHARKAQLADAAYADYLQAEKDGTLLESTLEDYLAQLSDATGIDLPALVDVEEIERILAALEDDDRVDLTHMTKEERREQLFGKEFMKAFKNVRGKLPPGLDIDLDP
jgi:hypothetical protein